MQSTTSRRAALAGLATLPAITTAAMSAALTDDPIFAVIERYRNAYNALPQIDETTEPARYREAENTLIASGDALFETPPQTIQGAAALAAFALQDAVLNNSGDWAIRTLEVLAEALPRIASQTAN